MSASGEIKTWLCGSLGKETEKAGDKEKWQAGRKRAKSKCQSDLRLDTREKEGGESEGQMSWKKKRKAEKEKAIRERPKQWRRSKGKV